MSGIEKSARRAQRQLLLNRWLTALGWSVVVAAGLFIVAVGVDRSFALFEEGRRFYGWLVLGLGVAVIIASTVWTLITRENLRLAAAKLDEAAGLKERLSTGLHCAGSSDPFAKAVVADAERISWGLPVRRHMPVRVPNSAPWAGGVLLAAMLFFWLFPTLDLAGKQNQREDQRGREQRVAHAKAVMRPLVAANLDKLRQDDPALKKDLDELDALKDAKMDSPAELRHEMLKKVEQIGKKLEQQADKAEMNKVAEFKQMMRKLAAEPKSNTPVGELSKALAQGDLKSAQQAIAAAQQQLTKEAKTPEEKQKAEELKKELEKLSGKLNEIAKDDKKMRDELAKKGLNEQEIKQALDKLAQKDIEGLKKQLADKGMSKEQAQQLAQQMQKKCSASGAASKLGQALGQAGGAKQAGGGMDGAGMEESAQGLSDASQQLSDMESLEKDLQSLQASMGQVNSMKDKLGQGCSQCNGTGMKNGKPCEGCQGSGCKCNGPDAGSGNCKGMGPDPGNGQGGMASFEKTNFNTTKTQAKVHTQAGSIISKQEFEDGQIKGEVSKEFTEAVISAEREAADNITNEKIPRPYQRGISQYFNHLRDDASKPATK